MDRSVWKIIALHTPHVTRHCARCDVARSFLSSDRFRVNAHKQRLDVWLIYRCEVCEQTWNLPVHERLSPTAIGGDLLDRYHDNDRAAAWQVAFDRGRFTRLGLPACFDTGYRVDRPAALTAEIRLQLVYPCRVRLDRLLANELAMPRAAVGALAVDVSRRELRKPVKDGQELVLRLPSR